MIPVLILAAVGIIVLSGIAFSQARTIIIDDMEQVAENIEGIEKKFH